MNEVSVLDVEERPQIFIRGKTHEVEGEEKYHYANPTACCQWQNIYRSILGLHHCSSNPPRTCTRSPACLMS